MRPPDAEGLGGQAWRVPTPKDSGYLEFCAFTPGLGTFAWMKHGQWWAILLVDVSEVAAPLYQSAEYEVAILELTAEPDITGEYFGSDNWGAVLMRFQFHGLELEQARNLYISAVEAVCAGVMDPGNQREWTIRLTKIVQDYRSGKFGGYVKAPLDVDPLTGLFTGQEVAA